MLSRRTRVQDKKTTRKGLFFLLLSISLLALAIIYGIPFLVNYTSLVSNLKKEQTFVNSDKTPPGPPQFDPAPPLFTHDPKIALKGRSEANSVISVLQNGMQLKDIAVDDSSKFSLELTLIQGDNTIVLSAKDNLGNQGPPSATYHILFDITPPKLEITKPQDGSAFYSLDQAVSVEGKTDIDSQVTINNHLAIVSSNGDFLLKIKLNEGDNIINIIAKDKAENQTEKDIKVTYTP